MTGGGRRMPEITPEEWIVRLDERGPDNRGGYEGSAEYASKCLLDAARRDPAVFGAALDQYRANPYGRDLDELLLDDERQFLNSTLTGFQWGWAVGIVAFLLEQGPVPNPAIVTLRLDPEENAHA